MMKTLLAAIAAALISIGSAQFQALAQVPPGYPADYTKVIEAAQKEGRLDALDRETLSKAAARKL